MTRRRLSEAREILEVDLAPGLSDFRLNAYRQELTEAEQSHREQAERYAEAQEQEARATRDEALKELTTVRDSYDDLAAEGKMGRLSAGDFAEKLHELRRRQEQAETQLRMAEQTAALVERIEADPIAFVDDLGERFPHMRADVSW